MGSTISSRTPPSDLRKSARASFKDRRKPNKIVLNPLFNLVFGAVVALTVLARAAVIALAAIWTTPTANQQSAFEAAGFGWKAGLGAILGFIGGKVA